MRFFPVKLTSLAVHKIKMVVSLGLNSIRLVWVSRLQASSRANSSPQMAAMPILLGKLKQTYSRMVSKLSKDC